MITITTQRMDEDAHSLEKTTLDYIKCDKVFLEKGDVFKQTNSLECSLILVISGSIVSENAKVQAGELYIAKKFSKTTFTAQKETEILQVIFTVSKFYDFLETSAKVLKADLEMAECFEKLYSLRYYKAVLPGVKEAYLLLIFNLITSACNSAQTEQRLYSATCDWIEENIRSYITPQTVAVAMSCTVTHLNRVVRTQSGKSLGEIISDRRISEIKQECKRGMSTERIAHRLGFASPELLRKYFRYHTGTSLKKYMLM